MKNIKRLFLLILIQFIFAIPAFPVVVYWEPAVPVPGGTVDIYYNVVEGTLPDNSDPVYIHLGINGWTNVNDLAMTADTAAGWWKYTFDIPLNCDVIDFVFTDLKGNWDNNGGVGVDWHISLNYSWAPLNPGPNDTITITIRNSDQGGNIMWYTQTNGRSAPPINSYLPEGSFPVSDGEAVESPLQGADGGNNYYLKIAPINKLRQIIDKIKFKIHWADGSYESSLFEIEMDYTPQAGDPQITFNSPDSLQEIVGQTEVSVTVDSAQSVELWAGIDSLAILNSAPFTASWTPSVNNFGEMNVLAKALNAQGRVSIVRRPVRILTQVTHEAAPANIKDGVNINGNQVTFALYAPAKAYISLLASFNREFPNGELMKLSGDTLWWLTKTLEPGTYFYQYSIQGEKLLADPWSKDVYWKEPGTENESSNYEYAKTRFTVGAAPFDWTDEGWDKPKFKDLVVYELYVRDFGGDHPGDYTDVRDKLEQGYFDSLGVNAIEFMPLNEFPGGWSWGYNPAFYMAPESEYGTPQELKELVDLLHEHGSAVIMDVVFNHMEGTAPLFQLYQPKNKWSYHDHDYAHCPYFHNQESQWFYKLQHWKEVDGRKYRTWRHVSDVLETWVKDYHFDGFRFDVSWGVGWDGYNNNGMSYYSWFLRQLDSTQYIIAEEDFYGGTNQVNVTETNANWHFRFYHQMKANLREASDGGRNWGDMDYTSGVLTYNNQPEGPDYTYPSGMLNFTESHDETRVIYECMVYSNPRMNRKKAIKKSKLGAAVLLTSQGVPMLYHGQEFGQDGAKNGTDAQPLKWDYLDTPEGQDLLNYYSRLVWFRKNWPALKSPDLKFLTKDSNKKLMVYQRRQGDDYVIVAANFDCENHEITVPFPTDGDWYEFTSDDTVLVQYGSLTNYNLPHSTAKIFTNSKNWLTDIGDVAEPVLPGRFFLEQNYPNPFNPETVISYQLAEGSSVELAVYNVLGQKVKTLVSEKQNSGKYQVRFNAADLASGIYFYRLKSGQKVLIKKMILIE